MGPSRPTSPTHPPVPPVPSVPLHYITQPYILSPSAAQSHLQQAAVRLHHGERVVHGRIDEQVEQEGRVLAVAQQRAGLEDLQRYSRTGGTATPVTGSTATTAVELNRQYSRKNSQ